MEEETIVLWSYGMEMCPLSTVPRAKCVQSHRGTTDATRRRWSCGDSRVAQRSLSTTCVKPRARARAGEACKLLWVTRRASPYPRCNAASRRGRCTTHESRSRAPYPLSNEVSCVVVDENMPTRLNGRMGSASPNTRFTAPLLFPYY